MFEGERVYTIPEQIAQRIKEALVAGQLQVGDRLPAEKELAVQFGVSRPTVREALKILVDARILRTKKGRQGGYIVAEFSPETAVEHVHDILFLSLGLHTLSLRDIYEVRRIIEVPAAGLAAQRRSLEELDRLAYHLPPADLKGWPVMRLVATDLQFHVAVAEATHNPLLVALLRSIVAVFSKLPIHFEEDRKEWVVKDLAEIYEAIAQQDEEAAQQFMDRHLSYFKDYFNMISDSLQQTERPFSDAVASRFFVP